MGSLLAKAKSAIKSRHIQPSGSALKQVRTEPRRKQNTENQCEQFNNASRTLDAFTSILQERINLEHHEISQSTKDIGFSR